MNKAIKINYDRFNDLFDYEPETGVIRNKVSRSYAKQGARAGSLHKRSGYRRLSVGGVNYLAHRVAWLLSHRSIPTDMQIDHINGVRDDNRIDNLRLATHQQNGFNRRRSNGDLPLGVTQCPISKKYRAALMVDQKPIGLGTFHSPELASFAYAQAKEIHHVIPSRVI
tara:strand:+ start:129 stop:632 length:504 start_codon:yes stop_codon:yes gene_type:complete